MILEPRRDEALSILRDSRLSQTVKVGPVLDNGLRALITDRVIWWRFGMTGHHETLTTFLFVPIRSAQTSIFVAIWCLEKRL